MKERNQTMQEKEKQKDGKKSEEKENIKRKNENERKESRREITGETRRRAAEWREKNDKRS